MDHAVSRGHLPSVFDDEMSLGIDIGQGQGYFIAPSMQQLPRDSLPPIDENSLGKLTN